MTNRFNIGGECMTYKDSNGLIKFCGHIYPRPDRLDIPLKRKKPTVWAVWNDLFHEDVPLKFIDKAFYTMNKAEWHTYLILTKRHERLLNYFDSPIYEFPDVGRHKFLRDHIYHGLTICNQQEADEKIPIFLQVPGKKFLSIEPMLGAIDLRNIQEPGIHPSSLRNALNGQYFPAISTPHNRSHIDAVILGGETGSGARPMHPDWVRSVRDQCQAAGVPFFFKGWGRWGLNWTKDDNGNVVNEWMDSGVKHSRLLDGKEHNELPWKQKENL